MPSTCTCPDQSFDAVWSVEAGPHMPDKQRYADELLRVLKPGGAWLSRTGIAVILEMVP